MSNEGKINEELKDDLNKALDEELNGELNNVFNDELNEVTTEKISEVTEVSEELSFIEDEFSEALETPEVKHDSHLELDRILEEAGQSNNKEHKKTKNGFKQALALVLIGSVTGGLSIGAGSELVKSQFGGTGIYGPAYTEVSNLQTDSTSSNVIETGFNNSDKDIVTIAESVGPSVVAITSKVAYQDYFNNVSYSEGAGSGVIFKVDSQFAYILTNYHVIEGAEELVVEITKDEFVNAVVVGKDKSTDIAIIKVTKKDMKSTTVSNIKPAVFGNSDVIKVGQTAIAIGNPLGYNNSVTVGVVSALDRELKGQNSLKLIQTDAAINPGNSGGALLNGNGEVIGINSVKIANEEVEGIGFAIPINSIKPLIEEILTKGFISRPYLGIYGQDISKETSEVYEIPVGVMVRSVVEGSGAMKGGLKAGDIIISINDTRVNSMTDLGVIIAKFKVGDTVKVKVVRNQSQNVTLTIKLQDSNQ